MTINSALPKRPNSAKLVIGIIALSLAVCLFWWSADFKAANSSDEGKTSIGSPSLALMSEPENIFLHDVEAGILPIHFDIKNISPNTVNLSNPEATCGCIEKMSLSSQRLNPGEACNLDVEVNFAGYRKDVRIEVILPFTQEQNKGLMKLHLPIAAKVLTRYDWSPHILEFELSQPGKQELNILPNNSREVSIISVKTSHKAFSTQIVDNQQKVIVSFNPGAWDGGGSWLGQHYVFVNVSDQIQPEFSVPLIIRP